MSNVRPFGTSLPLSERILDRLCDILYAADEIRGMIRLDHLGNEQLWEVDAAVDRVYEDVNELMKRMAD